VIPCQCRYRHCRRSRERRTDVHALRMEEHNTPSRQAFPHRLCDLVQDGADKVPLSNRLLPRCDRDLRGATRLRHWQRTHQKHRAHVPAFGCDAPVRSGV
jgi:hypothetical protein